MTDFADRISALRAKSNGALAEFMEAELDLASTFCDAARVERRTDPEALPRLIKNVQLALLTVERLLPRLENVPGLDNARERLEELRARLAALPARDARAGE